MVGTAFHFHGQAPTPSVVVDTIIAPPGNHAGTVTKPFPIQQNTQDPFPIKYTWTFDGNEWEWDSEFTQALYTKYSDPSLRHNNTVYDYALFVEDPGDDAYVGQLADLFRNAANQQGYSSDKLVYSVLAFVQSLPYASDLETTGFDEWPRFPIETLADRGGDCEDTSILLAALLHELGFGVVLIEPLGHMAVGVLVPDADGARYNAITWEGHSYAYVETTGDHWAIGEVPPEYQGRPVAVYPIQ